MKTWEDVERAAQTNPTARAVVDAVRSGRMSQGQAAITGFLLLVEHNQKLHDLLVDSLSRNPVPPFVV